MDIKKYVYDNAAKTKEASYALNILSTPEKNRILSEIINAIEANREAIKNENAKDMEAGKNKLSKAFLDRLFLDDKRISSMVESVQALIKLDDPVGEIFDQKKLPNGLITGKQRCAMGVVGMIYESRPNVTVDAATLCIKSGNGAVLRGGPDALHSNAILGKLIKQGIQKAGYSPDMVGIIESAENESVNHMLKAADYIDIIIPRGGEGLIKLVTENSIIPVIKHGKGTCSVFVNFDAKKEMAEEIIVNAKVQRPGVCNAIENLYIHKDYKYAKEMLQLLADKGVEIRAFGELQKVFPSAKKLDNMDEFYTEYLELILSAKLVNSLDEAADHIRKYGSGHSDSIVTENYNDAMKFLNIVNSAAVYVNASTRFTDGFEMGLGAEIGISTNKLHARGPMGLKELTTYKWIVFGSGQIRK